MVFMGEPFDSSVSLSALQLVSSSAFQSWRIDTGHPAG
jgi:hypothetical protein